MPGAIDHEELFPVSRTTLANLARDFQALLENYSADRETVNEIVSLTVAKYSEEHRFYHNLSHVGALLFEVENFKESLTDEKSVRLAVWFHDAVYEPRRTDNETASAQLAEEQLSRLKFAPEVRGKVSRMILATQNHAAKELDADGKLFLDLDLGILGAAESVYKKYARAIRAEYAHVPEILYRRGRRTILESFLAREFIYFSPQLRGALEERARLNIANEIKELS